MSDFRITTTVHALCKTTDTLWSVQFPSGPITDNMPEMQWLRAGLGTSGSRVCKQKSKLSEDAFREVWSLREKRLSQLRAKVQDLETENIRPRRVPPPPRLQNGSSTNTGGALAPDGGNATTVNGAEGSNSGEDVVMRHGPMHKRQLIGKVRVGTIAQWYRLSHGRMYLDELGIKGSRRYHLPTPSWW